MNNFGKLPGGNTSSSNSIHTGKKSVEDHQVVQSNDNTQIDESTQHVENSKSRDDKLEEEILADCADAYNKSYLYNRVYTSPLTQVVIQIASSVNATKVRCNSGWPTHLNRWVRNPG